MDKDKDLYIAYQEGYKAYFGGMKAEENPYAHLSTQADEWLDGYYDALDEDNELE